MMIRKFELRKVGNKPGSTVLGSIHADIFCHIDDAVKDYQLIDGTKVYPSLHDSMTYIFSQIERAHDNSARIYTSTDNIHMFLDCLKAAGWEYAEHYPETI